MDQIYLKIIGYEYIKSWLCKQIIIKSDSLLKESSPLQVDQFTYLESNISSTESNVDIRLEKPWNAIDRLSIIWKNDVSDKI